MDNGDSPSIPVCSLFFSGEASDSGELVGEATRWNPRFTL